VLRIHIIIRIKNIGLFGKWNLVAPT